MEANGHLLVTGGPGSGKTTISIIKAASIAEHQLRPGQNVLFLSFARATVSRVIEAIEREHQILPEIKKRVLIETYHAFFWRILKAHGYLIGLPRRLSILLPQDEAIMLSAIRNQYRAESNLNEIERDEKRQREKKEKQRLAFEEGRVCFDLFARLAGRILHGSQRVRELVSLMYPFVILDEFQDTNTEQWRIIQAIGKNSNMLALADPEQRIYDWLGADPERLTHFRSEFKPVDIDLGTQNHRSGGTDIRLFGDHVLTTRFREAPYRGIEIDFYEVSFKQVITKLQAMTKLVTCTLQSKQRLAETGRCDWSLAILVATKQMTRLVSDTFRSPPTDLVEIPHSAAVDMEGPILSAKVIAFLMQPGMKEIHFPKFVELLCGFFRGKGGERPSKADLKKADAIQKAYEDYIVRSAGGQCIRGNSQLIKVIEVYHQARSIECTGNPDTDWRAIRSVLEQGSCAPLKVIAEEVRNVRLLDRGVQLRQELSQNWRDNSAYRNSLEIIERTFIQDHFAMTHRPETGIVIMNMHKAKGKQFDEVIIFDGWPQINRGKIVANRNRIVRSNSRECNSESTRQNFRVSVTRGKTFTTILTPRQDPCILLP